VWFFAKNMQARLLDVTPCYLVDIYQRIGETLAPHYKERCMTSETRTASISPRPCEGTNLICREDVEPYSQSLKRMKEITKGPVSISVLRVEVRTRTSQIIITSYVVLLKIFGSWKPRQGNALTDESSTSKQEQCLFHFNSYGIFKCAIDDKLV
jgi:hypothetical protein